MRTIFTSHLGDARAVICRGGLAVRLTSMSDHKAKPPSTLALMGGAGDEMKVFSHSFLPSPPICSNLLPSPPVSSCLLSSDFLPVSSPSPPVSPRLLPSRLWSLVSSLLILSLSFSLFVYPSHPFFVMFFVLLFSPLQFFSLTFPLFRLFPFSRM